MSHCTKCCSTFAAGEEHCCICGKHWLKGSAEDCGCGEIRRFFDVKIKEFLEKNRLTNNYVVSPCLGQDCQSILKFAKAIRSIGFSSITDFLRDDKNYTMVFHGTPQVSGASDICCNSWSLGYRGRTGQAAGTGEYFTTLPETSYGYTGHGNGAVVLAIVINPKAFPSTKTDVSIGGSYRSYQYHEAGFTSEGVPATKMLKQTSTENWFIVENTVDLAFSLPIGVMQYHNPIDVCASCPRRKHDTSLQDLARRAIKSIGFEDAGVKPYAPSDLETIMRNIKAGTAVFDMTAANGSTYKIDLAKMIQTNLSTGGQRRIIIQ